MKGISLWQPWAFWVIAGIKTIETRTHKRFASLKGQDIFIHAAKKQDMTADNSADSYLTYDDFSILCNWGNPFNNGVTYGHIVGIVHVDDFRELTAEDSDAALIDCGGTKRYGLILSNIRPLKEPIPFKGSQGIVNYEFTDDQK